MMKWVKCPQKLKFRLTSDLILTIHGSDYSFKHARNHKAAAHFHLWKNGYQVLKVQQQNEQTSGSSSEKRATARMERGDSAVWEPVTAHSILRKGNPLNLPSTTSSGFTMQVAFALEKQSLSPLICKSFQGIWCPCHPGPHVRDTFFPCRSQVMEP